MRASEHERSTARRRISIVTFKDNSYIAEYDIQSGEEIYSAKTDYPVFCLMEYEGGCSG